MSDHYDPPHCPYHVSRRMVMATAVSTFLNTPRRRKVPGKQSTPNPKHKRRLWYWKCPVEGCFQVATVPEISYPLVEVETKDVDGEDVAGQYHIHLPRPHSNQP